MHAAGTNNLQKSEVYYVFHDHHMGTLKMIGVFISNVVRFLNFFFQNCNRFQYQQFSKITSFCRIDVLINETFLGNFSILDFVDKMYCKNA